ncbi:MAG: TldD/PmbA family protein [Candidatus Nanoarchaeia archaeon]
MADLINSAIKYALQLGADYAEARFEISSGNHFLLNNGVLEGASFGESRGIGVRLLINNTWGLASTNSLDTVSIRKVVERALAAAKGAKRTTSIRLGELEPSRARYEVRQKKPLTSIAPEEKISFLKVLDDSLLKTKLNFATRYFALSDEIVKRIYVNSEGSEIESKIPSVSLYYLFTIKGSTATQQRYWNYGSCGGWEVVGDWKLQEVLPEEAKALFKVLKDGQKPPAKPITLITGPQVSGIIAHESCGHPFEADRIFGREAAQAGESWVTPAMLGSKFATKAVNLVDDPTIPNSYGFYLYDDEGVKARKRYLIKDGLINEFYHNRETAGAMGIKSNGAARASDYDKEPIVRMSNTYFEPGEQSESELIKETKFGVYFKSFTEWNIDDLRYNNKYVSAEAYLIENGRLTKPIRNAVFEITTPALYAAIEAVGSNFELHSATCGKGEPLQGMRVTHGGGSLKLRNIRLK